MQMHSNSRGRLTACAAISLLSVMGPMGLAWAQESSGALDEIVVTAQRREQSAQDVGISIQAFGGEALREAKIETGGDVARLTPGVFISGSGGGQNSQFSIRGVTQNDFNDSIEAPVAVYIDEGYVPTLQGQVFGLFDLDRVEILKGPQGTLFGRNATGGLVHFVPRKPTETMEGFVDASYGRFNHVRIEAGVGGPIADKLMFRISGLYNRHDEILENIAPAGIPSLNIAPGVAPFPGRQGEDIWNDDTLAGRAQLMFQASDDLSIRLTGSAGRSNVSEGQYNQVASRPQFDSFGRLTNTVYAPGQPDFFGFVAPDKEKLQVSKDWALDDLNTFRTYNGQLHINYSGDDFDVVAITDWKRSKKYLGVDVEAGPENLINFGTKGNTRSISQELRVSGATDNTNWVVGGYFLDINSKVQNGFLAPRNSFFSIIALGFGPGGVDAINDFQLKTKTISAFGQVEYKFADQWTFILGGRIIREKQDFNWTQAFYANVDDYRIDTGTKLFDLPVFRNPDGSPGFALDDERSKTLWAGKAQLEYRPNDDLLLYVGVNRGVKGGAYNVTLPDGSLPLFRNDVGYGPETLYSYEGGFKATLLDGRATWNGAVFYYDYKNYQAFTFAGISGVVTNNDARTYGMETAFNVQITDDFNASLSFSLFDAKVKDLVVAPAVFRAPGGALVPLGAVPPAGSTQVSPAIVRDVKPSFAPEWQISGTLSYTAPMDVAGGKITFAGDFNYMDDYFHNLRNFDSNVLDGYFLANIRATWKSADEKFSVTAFLNNVTDKRYVNVGYDLATLCGCNEESYGKPRWWGIGAGFKF
jgi:iron complex outermembrane recepter protein